MTAPTNGVEVLTPDEVKQLNDERGTQFGLGDRLFGSFTEDDTVRLAYDLSVLDLRRMLADDGNARKIERVLSIPIRGAAAHITGSGPGADLVRANVGPMLDRLIEQCTGAITFRRAYFEKVWGVDDAGRFVYDKIAWRPPQSCTPLFDRKTGAPKGFAQRITDGSWWAVAHPVMTKSDIPGEVPIPAAKAFVYVHGRHREPIKGVSDLEVAFNAWEKKRKIRWLWAQYLEGQALPKLAAYGRDDTEAQNNARHMAAARASGVIPMVFSPDMPQPWGVIESSGRGADQYQAAIQYYNWEMTTSVLAGFTELANAAASGTGSYALSADQSEFFLASEQALADDIAAQIVEQVFTPLVVVNFGTEATVPGLSIGPIGNKQTDRSLSLIESIISSTKPMVPFEFIGFLLNQVSESLGLDTSEVAGAVTAWGARQQKEMEAAQAAQVAAASQPTAMRSDAQQQPLTGVAEAKQAGGQVAAGHETDGEQQVELSAPAEANRMRAPARHPSKRDRRRSSK